MVDDVNANIGVNIDTSSALASLKALQRQISLFHTQMAAGGAAANNQAAKLQSNLLNAVNATGQFQASMTRVNSTTEAFTTALEKNKLTMGQYFRYAGGASKTFGRSFKSEFDTISKVAVERVKDLQTQYISMGRDANGALQAIKIRPLTLDMQDLTTKTMIAAQKQQLFNQLMTQGSTNLLNFGKNTQWAGRQLMVGFTIPLTMFATAAAKSFMDIEKQIIKIRRVYGDFSTTVEETNKMVDSIKSLAGEYTKYGVAVKDTLGLASEAAAMGKTGQELLAQVAQATRLAVLGNVEQSQALETTISITNAFGVATDDLASKIDFLNAVENQSVTSIEDLTEAIPKAGPVVQQLGGNVEDLAFFLTAMKEGGINASEGANALKSGLAALINPTGKAKEMLQGFGINIEKIVNSNKGDVKGLVIDFASALDTLDPLNRARAIEQLFGKFQFSRLSTLFQNVIGEGTQASRVLELTKATTQELAILSQRELKKVEDTTTYKFEKAFADFQAALAPVGEQFLKVVTPILEFGTKLLEQFNSMGDGAKNFTIILTTVVAGIGPVLLMTVGLVANGVANLIKMFQLLGGIFKKTGVDTGLLGVQTDYMTQQQIEAAAVAASLNQSHSRLTQTFSVEAAALNSLTAAYQKAVTAQRGFGGGGTTTRSSRVPKKYARGVVSVPGPKGKGDVVPAMLSPGEAIIPAAMAKKYGGLINGMVAGSIPGYENGLEAIYSQDVGDNRRRRGIPAQIESITAAGYGKEAEIVKRQLLGAKISLGEARRVFSDFATAAKEGTDSVKDFMGKLTTSVKEYAATGQTNSQELVKSLRGKTGMRTQAQRASFAHIGSGVDMTAKEYVAKYGLDGLPPAQRKKFEATADKAPNTRVSIKHGLALDKLDLGVNSQMAGKGANVADFLKSYDQTGVEKWSKSIKIGGGNVEELAKSTAQLDKEMRKIVASAGKDAKIFDTAVQANEYIASTGKKAIALEAAYDQAIANIKDKRVVSSLETARATSTEVRLGGSQVGERRGAGGRNNAGENAALAASRTQAQNSGMTSSLTPTSISTSTARKIETRIGKDGKPRYYLNGRQVPNAVGEAAVEKVAKADRSNEQARTARANRATPSAPAPAGKQKIGSRIAGGVRSIASAGGGLGGMMAVGAIGTGVSMIPGLEGLGIAISTVGPLLMMLPGPIKLVAAALAGMVGVVMAANAAQEQQRKKAVELGNAQIMSIGAMNKMAEDMGTVSATQAREAEMSAKLTNVKEKELTAGQQYIAETESGKSLLSGVKSQQAAGESTKQIAETVASNLANSVAQNVITQQQGNEIIAALGIASGDIGISSGAAKQFKAYTADLTQTSGLTAAASLQSTTSAFNAATQFGSNQSIGGSVLDSIGRLGNFENLVPLMLGSSQGYERASGTMGTFTDRNAARAASTSTINAYGQSVGGTDAINAQYDTLVAQAKTQEEIDALETKRTADLQKQNEISNQLYEQIRKQKVALGTTDFNANFLESIKQNFGETSPAYTTAQAINKLGDSTFKTRIQTQLESGTLSAESINVLMDYASKNKGFGAAYDLAIKTAGEVETLNMISALQATGAKVETQTLMLNIVNSGDYTAQQLTEAATAIEWLNTYGDVTIDVNANNGQVLKTFANDVKNINGELKKNGNKFTTELVAKYTGSKAAADALKDNANFNKLSKVNKVQYLAQYHAVFSSAIAGNDPGYAGWARLRRKYGMDDSAAAYAAAVMDKAAASSVTSGGGSGGGDSTDTTRDGGGGGGTPEDKKLAKLNKAKDKNQKALNVIALKEDAINKVYDKRRKTLEEIAKINANIAEQQKDQLDVAIALTSGDISAAARAVQAQRIKAASYAQEEQIRALEAKRQAELDGIIVNGKTREAYEAEIARLNLAIAERELEIALGDTSSGGSGGSSGGSSGSSGSTDTGTTTPTTPGRPPRPDAAMGFYYKWSDEYNMWIKNVRHKPASPSGVGEIWSWDYPNQDWKIYKVPKPGPTYVWDNDRDSWNLPSGGGGGPTPMAAGGLVGYSMGGRVANRYMAAGGYLGSDTIPAMLTPGEFVVKRPAVQGFGVKNLEAINSGQSANGSVYNYSVTVNAGGNANADDIARAVMTKIKQVEGTRLRGNRL